MAHKGSVHNTPHLQVKHKSDIDGAVEEHIRTSKNDSIVRMLCMSYQPQLAYLPDGVELANEVCGDGEVCGGGSRPSMPALPAFLQCPPASVCDSQASWLAYQVDLPPQVISSKDQKL
jgi:hypothetical protein